MFNILILTEKSVIIFFAVLFDILMEQSILGDKLARASGLLEKCFPNMSRSLLTERRLRLQTVSAVCAAARPQGPACRGLSHTDTGQGTLLPTLIIHVTSK